MKVRVACIPSARPRSRPGNVVVMRAGESAIMTAAPTPCTSRPPMRVGRVGARPHRSEPRPKTMNPAPKTGRYPHMSPSRPAESSSDEMVTR